MGVGTALWIVVPLAAIHLLVRRNRPLLACQLLVDVMLLLLPGRILLRGAHVGPGVAGALAWGAPVTIAGSPEQSDLPLQFEVWWEEVRRLVATGEPPWVSDRLGGGTPLFANGQTGLPFPLQAPVWALGAVRGSDVMAVWKLELAALGAFVFLRRLRLAAAAAAAGAVAFAFGLYPLSWLVVPLAWVVAATPWAFWALLGTLRGSRRESALLAALLGVLAGWSVHAESAAFLWLAVAGAGLVLGWGRWRRLGRLLVPVAVAVCVAGIGAVPTLLAIRGSAKLGALAAGPAYPSSLVDWGLRGRVAALLITPARDGDPASGSWIHPFPAAPVMLGVGSVAIALAIAARPRRRQRRATLALAAVGGGAAVLVWQLPGLAEVGARLPVLGVMTWPRAGFLVSFALAMLAGLGADGVVRSARPTRLVSALALVQVAAIVLGVTAPRGSRARVLRSCWAPVVAGAAAPAIGFAGGWAIPAVVAAESLAHGWRVLPASAAPAASPRDPLAAALGAAVASEGGRILAIGGALPANLGASLGLADLRDHDPLRPLALAGLQRALGANGLDLPGEVTSPWAGLSGAWGVRWLVAPPASAAPADRFGWERVLTGGSGELYRNPRALPVVRLASRAIAPPGDPGAGGWERVDFGDTAVVAAPPGLGGHGELTLVADRPYRHEARVEADGAVLAVLHAPRAPGWRASVDGRPVAMLDADLGAMGVLVGAGRHVVRWEYAPPGLGLGAGLTLLGLAGCAALALSSRRSPR